MRYQRPLQRQSDKLWHYTETHDNHSYPIGACADGCPGHATADEAREHYRQGLLAKVEIDRRDPEKLDRLHRCDVKGCSEWGPHEARVAGDWHMHWSVCEAHANKDAVAGLITTGDAMVS